jgi:hypothetical protein
MLPNDWMLPPMKIQIDIPQILVLDRDHPTVCFRCSPLFLTLRRGHPRFDGILELLGKALRTREVKYLYTLTDDHLIYAADAETNDLEAETIGDLYAAMGEGSPRRPRLNVMGN